MRRGGQQGRKGAPGAGQGGWSPGQGRQPEARATGGGQPSASSNSSQPAALVGHPAQAAGHRQSAPPPALLPTRWPPRWKQQHPLEALPTPPQAQGRRSIRSTHPTPTPGSPSCSFPALGWVGELRPRAAQGGGQAPGSGLCRRPSGASWPEPAGPWGPCSWGRGGGAQGRLPLPPSSSRLPLATASQPRLSAPGRKEGRRLHVLVGLPCNALESRSCCRISLFFPTSVFWVPLTALALRLPRLLRSPAPSPQGHCWCAGREARGQWAAAGQRSCPGCRQSAGSSLDLEPKAQCPEHHSHPWPLCGSLTPSPLQFPLAVQPHTRTHRLFFPAARPAAQLPDSRIKSAGTEQELSPRLSAASSPAPSPACAPGCSVASSAALPWLEGPAWRCQVQAGAAGRVPGAEPAVHWCCRRALCPLLLGFRERVFTQPSECQLAQVPREPLADSAERPPPPVIGV